MSAWRQTIAGRFTNVSADGVEYALSVIRGKRVRIAYRSGYGHHWRGVVRRVSDGTTLFEGRVDKNVGAPSLLKFAGVK
jgi:hypothetical protein